MNKWLATGRVVKDPNFGDGSENSPVTFTIAVQNEVKAEGGGYEADFIEIAAFGSKRKPCRNLAKGRSVAVECRLKPGSYTNKNGVKVYTTNIILERIDFLDKKPETLNQNGQMQQSGMVAPQQDGMQMMPQQGQFVQMPQQMPVQQNQFAQMQQNQVEQMPPQAPQQAGMVPQQQNVMPQMPQGMPGMSLDQQFAGIGGSNFR